MQCISDIPCCRPLWNSELGARLDCVWSDVSAIAEHLWTYYAESFPDEVAEHERQELELESGTAVPPADDEADAAPAAAPLAPAPTATVAAPVVTPASLGPVARTVVEAIVTPPDENVAGQFTKRLGKQQAESVGASGQGPPVPPGLWPS